MIVHTNPLPFLALAPLTQPRRERRISRPFRGGCGNMVCLATMFGRIVGILFWLSQFHLVPRLSNRCSNWRAQANSSEHWLLSTQ
jgi:hypothetical protein